MLHDNERVYPYPIAILEHQLENLRRRLANARWPDREPVGDDSQGIRLARLLEVCQYWQERYDWRRCERSLNCIGSYITRIDGLDIHFLHAKSMEPTALPEFKHLAGPLIDPVAHGARATDAIEVVVPSLPGFGPSERSSDGLWSGANRASVV